MVSTKKLAFSNNFHREFTKATSLRSRKDVVRRFISRVSEQHDEVASNAHAIETVLDVRGKDVGDLDDLRAELIAAMQTVTDTEGDEEDGTTSQRRQRKAVKALVALWGLEVIEHYKWHETSRDFALSLLEQAKANPDWNQFVIKANMCMMIRHEKSISIGGKNKKIGEQEQDSNTTSALTTSDIKDIQTYRSPDERKRLQSVIRAWDSSCDCLRANGKKVTDDRLQHFVVRLDKHGMLDRSPFTGRNLCPDCATAVRGTKRKRKDSLAPVTQDSAALTTGSNNPPGTATNTTTRASGQPGQESEGSDKVASGTNDTSDRPEATLDDQHRSRNQELIARSTFLCPRCKAPCKKCVLPPELDHAICAKRCDLAHDISSRKYLPRNQAAVSLLKPIHFASVHVDLATSGPHAPPTTPKDYWLLSYHAWRTIIENNVALPPFVIIRDTLSDAGEYDPSSVADIMDQRFRGKRLSVIKNNVGFPQPENVKKIVDRLHKITENNKTKDSMHSWNLLSLDDFVEADKPKAVKLPRFRLLNDLAARLHASKEGVAEKSVRAKAVDVESCLRFCILGFDGAFSGPHCDALFGTWLRNLFGIKIWWFVPDSSQEKEWWPSFQKEGPDWAAGEYARAVVIEPDDVIIMSRPCPHAVFTAETSMMVGGMFWDFEQIIPILEFVKRTARWQSTSNEPVAFQLPAILEELRQWVDASPKLPNRAAIRKAIKDVLSLGCQCSPICDDKCSCKQQGRRCLAWCAKHPELPLGKDAECMTDLGGEQELVFLGDDT